MMLSRVTSKTTFPAGRVVSTIHRTKVATSRGHSTLARGRHVAKSSLPGSAQWLLSSNNLPNAPSPACIGRSRLLGDGIGAGISAWSTCVRSAATFTITPMGSNRKNRSQSTAAVAEEEDGDLLHLTEGAAGRVTGTGGIDAKAHKEDWMINLGRDSGRINEWLTGPRSYEWYTGVHPSQCPGVCSDGALRSLPLPNLAMVTRKAAREYFDNSWALYEVMFAGLNGEEPFYRPPVHGLRHPQIFYYGHTPCLYINKLRVSGVLEKPVNAYFESIFEVGVDEMLWDDMHKNDMVWPTVAEVHEYRKQVYETVVEAIETHPSLSDDGVLVNQEHPFWALFMGFEHERIHLETSSVLFRETPLHLVQTPHHWPPMHPSSKRSSLTTQPTESVDFPSNRMVSVSGSNVDLGKPADFPSYGWDNEYGERRVNVPDFQASENMVTNGEFFQFVTDGGYRNEKYWCDDGWAWRTHRNMKWPFFWEPSGPSGSNEYSLRAIFEVVPMQWDWPVDVNYYEAKAYCRWKAEKERTSRSYRLLTEAEHHLLRSKEHNLNAARQDPTADKVMVTAGEQFPDGPTGSNLNLAYSSQNPVGTYPASTSGHNDVTGNAWEWTEDHFNPLSGFEVHHVYEDFSTPCFDGKHSSIVGGSFISTGDEASVFARFHFRPHFLQHSGFRLVSSDGEAPATHLFPGNFSGQVAARDEGALPDAVMSNDDSNVYESIELRDMYLGLHFSSSGAEEGVKPILPHPNCPEYGLRFPQRVAQLLCTLKPERTNNRALDIGCAVGGSSFELAKHFDHVEAFDFSASFIETAKQMQSEARIKFNVPIEADIFTEVIAKHDNGVTPEVLEKVRFFTGDACRLKQYAAEIGTVDGVVMANLLCRLPDPLACLDGMSSVVNKGGVVVMVTPFSWLEEFTPRSKWLGGYPDPVSGEPIYSKGVLRDTMEARGFEQIHEEEMPLLIREHQRKYQYIVSEATGWRKL